MTTVLRHLLINEPGVELRPSRSLRKWDRRVHHYRSDYIRPHDRGIDLHGHRNRLRNQGRICSGSNIRGAEDREVFSGSNFNSNLDHHGVNSNGVNSNGVNSNGRNSGNSGSRVSDRGLGRRFSLCCLSFFCTLSLIRVQRDSRDSRDGGDGGDSGCSGDSRVNIGWVECTELGLEYTRKLIFQNGTKPVSTTV